MPPVHPGETLREDFLKPLGLSANRLAIALQVPVTRVNDIIHGKRAITADTALRLARYFETTPQIWLNLQTNYDLELASRYSRPRDCRPYQAVRSRLSSPRARRPRRYCSSYAFSRRIQMLR